MADYVATTAELKSVADAIRSKGGTSARLKFPDGFNSAVSAIKTGNDTSDATATAADIMHDTTAYIASGKVTGTFSLDTELTAQDSKIAAIKAALAGKSSGGGGSCGKWSRAESEAWTPAENTQQYPLPKAIAEKVDLIIISRPYAGAAENEVQFLAHNDPSSNTYGLLLHDNSAAELSEYVSFLGFIGVGTGNRPITFVGGQTYTVTRCYK